MVTVGIWAIREGSWRVDALASQHGPACVISVVGHQHAMLWRVGGLSK